ncbi:MAG: tetratricopeptide (TPR) repeat protein [Lysobacterales bacterium]|jgi:tetratricopeptide (TPR) repeat protein
MSYKPLIISLFVLFSLISPSPSFANPIKTLYEESAVHVSKNEYAQAIEKLEKLLSLYANFAPAYNLLALAHQQKGSDIDEILYLYDKAIEIDPNFTEVYQALSKIYFTIGEFEKSIKTGRRAIDLNPKLGSMRLSLAWTYLLGVEDATNAAILFREVLGQKNIPHASFGLGLALFMDEQRSEVLEIITELKQANESDMARHLENMMREGKYSAPKNFGTPLARAPRKRIKDLGKMSIRDMPGGYIEVRLRDLSKPMRKVVPSTFNPREESNQTGEQRLHELQQKKFN